LFSAEWVLLFRQTLPFLYGADQWELNRGHPEADNYGILNDLEKYRGPAGDFHLQLWYPEKNKGNEWRQTRSVFLDLFCLRKSYQKEWIFRIIKI
jgi:hypothetical protein